MRTRTTQAGNGGATLGLILVLFLTLKLTHTVSWSWWWVLAPLWAPAALLALLLAGAVLLGVADGWKRS